MNVKDSPWKAAGNGAADDYPAIQAAIDATANAGGGTVLLPAGIYSIRQPLHWTAPDVYLQGDGAARILCGPKFSGTSVIAIGKPSSSLQPTYRGGIRNVTVDLSSVAMPDLIGVELTQTWFMLIDLLRIVSTNGLPKPMQTAFQMSAGGVKGGANVWSANNSVRDIQISGSFLYSVRHIPGAVGSMVNGTNYFGGFGYGTAANKAGSCGFRIDDAAGDSTRVYGIALEDYDTGVYVGSQNNGPLDFRIEDCTTPYACAPGISFSRPTAEPYRVL
jgi:hypothetical protein